MYLWKVWQDEQSGWDTYDSMVVAAKTEDEARKIFPNEGCEIRWSETLNSWVWPINNNIERYDSSAWAADIENVKVKKIGTAEQNVKAGVIIASFNAG